MKLLFLIGNNNRSWQSNNFCAAQKNFGIYKNVIRKSRKHKTILSFWYLLKNMILNLVSLLSNIRFNLARRLWYAANRCAGVNWAFLSVVCGLTGTFQRYRDENYMRFRHLYIFEAISAFNPRSHFIFLVFGQLNSFYKIPSCTNLFRNPLLLISMRRQAILIANL